MGFSVAIVERRVCGVDKLVAILAIVNQSQCAVGLGSMKAAVTGVFDLDKMPDCVCYPRHV